MSIQKPHFVYMGLQEDGKCLYVGETHRIIERITEHKNNRDWYSHANKILFAWVENETKAKIVERILISRHKPIINTGGKEDIHGVGYDEDELKWTEFDLNSLSYGRKHEWSPFLEGGWPKYYEENLSDRARIALSILQWVIEDQYPEYDNDEAIDVPIPLGKSNYDKYFEQNPPIKNYNIDLLAKGIDDLRGCNILCNASKQGEYYYNNLAVTTRFFEEFIDSMNSGPLGKIF